MSDVKRQEIEEGFRFEYKGRLELRNEDPCLNAFSDAKRREIVFEKWFNLLKLQCMRPKVCPKKNPVFSVMIVNIEKEKSPFPNY